MKLLTLFFLFLINPGLITHHLQAHEIGNLEKSSLAELVDSTSPSVVTIAVKGTRELRQNQNPFSVILFLNVFLDNLLDNLNPREKENLVVVVQELSLMAFKGTLSPITM